MSLKDDLTHILGNDAVFDDGDMLKHASLGPEL